MSVQAPPQDGAAASDAFDLEVSLTTGSASDTELQAVVYDLIPHDYALILDRSGSMANNGRLGSAKAAARLYANATNQEDHLGVVSFNQDATTDFAFALCPDTRAGPGRFGQRAR